MKKLRNNFVFVFVALAFAAGGCFTRTVAPKPIEDHSPSFSPETGRADSGVLGFYTNSVGVVYMEVTPSLVRRYDALVAKHGDIFTPPLKPGEGVESHGSNYVITLSHFAKFMKMNRREKAAQ